ncbi:Acetyl-coenzyme A synthetase [Rhodococcus sp. RD6.2]|uniref:acetate--CoA ligase n=1 Tax=Rhodococcus sp. RD6.2 TaxID=260936 RepID=UPI00063B250B|nr:acetate--CoA ligase [Rhodococcus sp. RD6.2]CRK51202.1 Acetyl-coenzyme A synthetase [Rhodococcus sp. RD6.2]
MTIVSHIPAAGGTTPNFTDYDGERARFSWAAVDRELGAAPGGCNIAHYAVDRHLHGPLADHCAFRFVGSGESATGSFVTERLTFAELGSRVRRFTNVLRALGVGKGDRVFVILGRIPEMYIAILGALRNGCVVSPLFSAFGPEPLATRIRLGAGQMLVTTDSLYRRRIASIRSDLPTLRHVLVIGGTDAAPSSDTVDFATAMSQVDDVADITPTSRDDPALLHFTSGTTGTPKGAIHVHGAVATHFATGRYALDLHPTDTFWCTADPGWVTGTSYGVITPLLHGITSVVDPAEFDAERWYRILAEQAVTVWYTAPTAIRMLMKAGPDLARTYAFPRLRFVASVGEPLNPDAVIWGRDVLGHPVHDNWWQTETGGIMIANTPGFDIKPGSMGRPLPGVDACIVAPRRDGDEARDVTVVDASDTEGELALRRGWPSMFRGYLNNDERYRRCFAGDWYLTGDLAKRDEDGYFWFVGRADDVIKSAGHLIGPFEVENVLMQHPAVAEAGVIGVPDETVGDIVKAFVSLSAGWTADDALRRELLAHARTRLGAAVAPKSIDFVDTLPHTRSGKIMRRLLKARELGLPEGDTSTLEAGR